MERLEVTDPAVGDRCGEELGAVGDRRDHVVFEHHVRLVLVRPAGLVLGPEQHCVLGPQLPPAGLVQRLRGFGSMVIHEPVELLDRHHRLSSNHPTQGPTSVRATGDAVGLHGGHERPHERPQLGWVVDELRPGCADVVDVALQPLQAVQPGLDRRPRVDLGIEARRQPPLRPVSQPRVGEVAEVGDVPSVRFVWPLRDPRVSTGFQTFSPTTRRAGRRRRGCPASA